SIARFSSLPGSASTLNESATIMPQMMLSNLDPQRGGGVPSGMGCLGNITWAVTAHIFSQFAGGFSTLHALTTAARAGEAAAQMPITMTLANTHMRFLTETSPACAAFSPGGMEPRIGRGQPNCLLSAESAGRGSSAILDRCPRRVPQLYACVVEKSIGRSSANGMVRPCS